MAADVFKTSSNATLAWDVAANWSTGAVPQPGNDVTINAPSSSATSTSTVSIAATDPAYTVQSLTMTGAASNGLTDMLSDSGSLTVTGATALSNADFSVQNGGKASLAGVTLTNNAGITVGGFLSGSAATFTATSLSGSGFLPSFIIDSGLASIGSMSGLDVNVYTGGSLAVGTSSGTNEYILRGGAISFATTSGSLSDDFEALNTSTVDLTSLRYQAGETVQVTANASGSVQTYTATIRSALGATLFTLNQVQPGHSPTAVPLVTTTQDAAGDTLVTIACFTPGTAIQTPQGERPAGDLQIGDLVTTLDGTAEPIVWIGRRSYAGRFLARQPRLLPVRIRAGALGDGLPHRDLLVSPCHAMFLDGVLVPAGSLVNGVTIVQERLAERVDYVHIELARHDIILAEGAPSETFLDDDSRTAFHNAAEYGVLYPDAAASAAPFCAPRVSEGYTMEAIRSRLFRVAGFRRQAA